MIPRKVICEFFELYPWNSSEIQLDLDDDLIEAAFDKDYDAAQTIGAAEAYGKVDSPQLIDFSMLTFQESILLEAFKIL